MIKEFKEFISRGNVLDMAVGVIVGNAFKDIVNSLVENVFTPLMGLVLGGVNFQDLSWTPFGETTFYYGKFIQSIIDFLIVAMCLFIIVKVVNKLTHLRDKKKKEEEKEVIEEVVEEEPVKSAELETLEEIRDLLKHDVRSK